MSSPPAQDQAHLGFLFSEVLRDLPEFVPRYLELATACDDDPDEPLILAELAEFVAGRLAVISPTGSAVQRALELVEALLVERDGDDIGRELVGYAFFDHFTVEDRRHLARRLGPLSLALLEWLEVAPDADPCW
ncbi:MAG TPA: hypothetical protein VG032_02630 [Acidimicrobiales bacterium]|jgi:hypothetical protein|nr:hypothetical protein [Acidimicrobiales bacterium]